LSIAIFKIYCNISNRNNSKHNMINTVLFDADGTLLDSMNEIFGAVCKVFESQGVVPPDFEDYLLDFRFPFGGYYRSRGVKLSDKEILCAYLKAYEDENGEYNPPFHSDAPPLIRWLHDRRVRCKIITANSTENVRRVLASLNFDDLIECTSAGEKVEAIREEMSKSRFGHMIPFVGDTCADVDDGKKAGVFTVAVLRGQMRLAPEFLKAGAKICIPSLSYLTEVVTC
jgi:phosphoglycolate phosphatase-like HAD superfamily hydrolase